MSLSDAYRRPVVCEVVDALRFDHVPKLRAPVLVAAFTGWNDAGDAASDAVTHLIQDLDATRFAAVDPEPFSDFQAARPTVELVDGVIEDLSWPTTECFAAEVDEADRDVVVVLGPEPNFAWRVFSETLVELAAALDVELVVPMGALLADVPHTRPTRITGAVSDPELGRAVGLVASRYEGPTGIVGVLHDAYTTAGIASASLWVPVPHYLASPPNPKATRALLGAFSQVSGVPLDLVDLDRAVGNWEARIDVAADSDHDVESYVRELEERYDAEAADGGLPIDPSSLPSGDALAAELQRYLRGEAD